MIAVWLNTVLATFIALLPIANPFSTSALFLTITQGDTEEQRRHQAKMGCIYMFGILFAFLVAGGLIMQFFGISIPGLRIAGGLVVARIGMGMLGADVSATDSEVSKREALRKRDISFSPLAMPSLSGPGAIAVTIGLASDVDHVIEYSAIAAGIAVSAVVCYLVLRASTRVTEVLGVIGMNALGRIMGFLLLCVGVQFMVDGVSDVVSQEELLRRIMDAYGGANG